MYIRRFREMNYFYAFRAQKKYGIFESQFDRMLSETQSLFPPTQENLATEKKEFLFAKESDQGLIDNLFAHYPDLQYIPHKQTADGNFNTDKNYILNFIQKQKSFIKQGYQEKKAFEMTEQIFQKRIQRKIDQNDLIRGLAADNRARSFMTQYQQQAEYESRIKVNRLQTDIYRFEQNEKILKEENDKIYENQFDGNENTNQIQNSKVAYARVLDKMINIESDEPQNSKIFQAQESVEEFLSRSKNMFQQYYQRAATKDRLSYLTDEQITNFIRDSPTKLKKRLRKLLKYLEKYQIKLSENGSIDWGIAPAHVQNKLFNDQMVKIALLEKDLDFEFPHLEYKKEQAQLFKQQLKQVNIQQKESQQELINQIQKEKMLLNNENMVTHEKIFDRKDQKSESDDDQQDIQIQINPQLRIDKATLNVLRNNSATYKLFETVEERLQRIEKKWLQKKIVELELDDNQEALDIRQKDLEKVIADMRRLKFKIEQKAILEANNRIFQEHSVFTDEEIMIDYDAQIENMENYLNQSYGEKRLTSKQQQDDQRISKLIKRNEFVIDNVEYFSENLMGEKDTIEYKNQHIKEEMIRKQKEQEEYYDDLESAQKDPRQSKRKRLSKKIDITVPTETGKDALMEYIKAQKDLQLKNKKSKGKESEEKVSSIKMFLGDSIPIKADFSKFDDSKPINVQKGDKDQKKNKD